MDIPPRKPSLDPVPEAIIAATESGMMGENLLCSSLPSPVLRHVHGNGARAASSMSEDVRREDGYFPAAYTRSSEESQGQPGHESEVVRDGGEERRVRWMGMDV